MSCLGATLAGDADDPNPPARARGTFETEDTMEFDVTIEIPKGNRNKYEIDHETGRIRLDRNALHVHSLPG